MPRASAVALTVALWCVAAAAASAAGPDGGVPTSIVSGDISGECQYSMVNNGYSYTCTSTGTDQHGAKLSFDSQGFTVGANVEERGNVTTPTGTIGYIVTSPGSVYSTDGYYTAAIVGAIHDGNSGYNDAVGVVAYTLQRNGAPPKVTAFTGRISADFLSHV